MAAVRHVGGHAFRVLLHGFPVPHVERGDQLLDLHFLFARLPRPLLPVHEPDVDVVPLLIERDGRPRLLHEEGESEDVLYGLSQTVPVEHEEGQRDARVLLQHAVHLLHRQIRLLLLRICRGRRHDVRVDLLPQYHLLSPPPGTPLLGLGIVQGPQHARHAHARRHVVLEALPEGRPVESVRVVLQGGRCVHRPDEGRHEAGHQVPWGPRLSARVEVARHGDADA
mmetsp:Transcript_29867/g.83456  ORF Transcript_29867/g.83456 Transcript_29867/m.83456 type:complete len:225 (-) Transcript_29867:214-888(-)